MVLCGLTLVAYRAKYDRRAPRSISSGLGIDKVARFTYSRRLRVLMQAHRRTPVLDLCHSRLQTRESLRTGAEVDLPSILVLQGYRIANDSVGRLRLVSSKCHADARRLEVCRSRLNCSLLPLERTD